MGWGENRSKMAFFPFFFFSFSFSFLLISSTLGAGFSLAMACDFRICSSSASFISAFIRIGFPPHFFSSTLSFLFFVLF